MEWKLGMVDLHILLIYIYLVYYTNNKDQADLSKSPIITFYPLIYFYSNTLRFNIKRYAYNFYKIKKNFK